MVGLINGAHKIVAVLRYLVWPNSEGLEVQPLLLMNIPRLLTVGAPLSLLTSGDFVVLDQYLK